MIDRSGLLNFICDQLVLLIEKEDTELLSVLMRHDGGAVFDYLRP